MMNGLFMLLSLSTLMAIASFLAGLLPLSFALSQSQLRLVSTVGMGVLVGTSLIVIIPEGVETLYSANKVTQSHSRRETEHAVLHARWRNDELFQTTRSPQPPRIKRSDNGVIDAINSAPGPVLLPGSKTEPYSKHDPPLTPTNPGEVGILGAAEVTTPQNESIDQVSRTPHAWIGISLILGFILMYLIDKLPSLPSVLTQRTSNVYSLSDLGSTNLPFSSLSSSKGTFSTTLGLVIHSAADGIALGATSAQPSLSLIIFVAIMVHKAPAAFGLTSTLLRQGLGKRPARVHLLVFSLAAPIGAICTWLVVHILGGGGAIGSEASMRWWTGVLLLFSGGTFLYVAMHTMQNDTDIDDIPSGYGNGHLDGSHGRDPSRPRGGKSVQLVLAAVGGMLLPLVTQLGHVH